MTKLTRSTITPESPGPVVRGHTQKAARCSLPALSRDQLHDLVRLSTNIVIMFNYTCFAAFCLQQLP